MTSATFITNHEGKYIGFKIEGHSGFAEPGKDIVCAGISTMAQAAILGVVDIAKVKSIYNIDYQNTKMSLVVTDREADKMDKAEIFIKTTKAVCESIHDQFPDHVQIHVEEANVL